MSEIENDCFRDMADAQFSVELLHRATCQGNQEAREAWQRCFSGILRGWLYRHPRKEEVGRFDSEEYYLAQAFERFWQATTLTQRVEFHSLAAALQYLRASLNGAILDTLRAYARSGKVSLPEPGELYMDGVTDGSEVWEVLPRMLPNEREQRLAYLLFHCGLKSREIVCFYPQEFSDIQEICHIRHSIMEQLICNADQLCW